MINEEKVKIMDRLALYEKQEGRKYLPGEQVLQE